MRTLKLCAFVCLLVLFCLLGFFSAKHYYAGSDSHTTDTVIHYDTTEIEIKAPTIKPVVVYVHDTVYSVDSVPVYVRIPLTSKVYEDSTYRAVVTGYRATLDSLRVYQKTVSVTNTVFKTEYKLQKPKFSVGPQVGWGLNANGSGFYVGIGVQYNLINF